MPKPLIEVETTIAVPPAKVWAAMRQGAMFPGTEIDTDWQAGHPIVFSGEWNGKAFTDRGEIRRLTETEELSFTHWSDKAGTGQPSPSYHLVQYRLYPAGSGTRVTLSQFNEGQDTTVDAKTKAEFEKNWTMMLESLKKAAEAQ